MARGVVRPTADLSSEVIFALQRFGVFGGLHPEDLLLLGRQCRLLSVTADSVGAFVDAIDDAIVFVVDGSFQSVLVDTVAEAGASGAGLRHPLAVHEAGDIFGAHRLLPAYVTQRHLESRQIALRAVSRGSLLILGIRRFSGFLATHPSVKDALLQHVLEQGLTTSLQLGEAEAQMRRGAWILDRVEAVAEFLSNASSGGEKTTQRRYLLKSLPDLRSIGQAVSTTHLQQAYLTAVGNREDRIRVEDGERYYRTTKYGSGMERNQFTRTITSFEYNDLKSRRQGRLIVKNRHKIKIADDIVLAIDDFLGEGDLEGLRLLEADFATPVVARDFSLPDWIAPFIEREVTEDKSYANHSLSLRGLPSTIAGIIR